MYIIMLVIWEDNNDVLSTLKNDRGSFFNIYNGIRVTWDWLSWCREDREFESQEVVRHLSRMWLRPSWDDLWQHRASRRSRRKE